jgi:hypothetical protein
VGAGQHWAVNGFADCVCELGCQDSERQVVANDGVVPCDRRIGLSAVGSWPPIVYPRRTCGNTNYRTETNVVGGHINPPHQVANDVIRKNVLITLTRYAPNVHVITDDVRAVTTSDDQPHSAI